MADLGEDLELFEIFPRSPDTEIWYDARDVQAAPDDTQQSDDNVSNTSTTPDPDPVISEGSSRSSSAISHLWRAVVFGKDPTLADILTFLGFPLVILGAWAAVQAIRMAQWTQWKDSFEWCENHNWTYPGCTSLRDNHLIIPNGPRAMKRFDTGTGIERFNDILPTGSGMSAMDILQVTLYVSVVNLFDLVRRFLKNRKACWSDETGTYAYWKFERAKKYFYFSPLRQDGSSRILEFDEACSSGQLRAAMSVRNDYTYRPSVFPRLIFVEEELQTFWDQVPRAHQEHYILRMMRDPYAQIAAHE